MIGVLLWDAGRPWTSMVPLVIAPVGVLNFLTVWLFGPGVRAWPRISDLLMVTVELRQGCPSSRFYSFPLWADFLETARVWRGPDWCSQDWVSTICRWCGSFGVIRPLVSSPLFKPRTIVLSWKRWKLTGWAAVQAAFTQFWTLKFPKTPPVTSVIIWKEANECLPVWNGH